MRFSWQVLGIEAVRLVISSLFSLALGVFLFRRYIAPGLTAALEDSINITKKIASLGGIKKADYENTQELTKAVTLDLIKTRFPEIEFIKMALSPATWQQVEEAMETNPAGVMELIEKYGHYFTKDAEENQESYMF